MHRRTVQPKKASSFIPNFVKQILDHGDGTKCEEEGGKCQSARAEGGGQGAKGGVDFSQAALKFLNLRR